MGWRWRGYNANGSQKRVSNGNRFVLLHERLKEVLTRKLYAGGYVTKMGGGAAGTGTVGGVGAGRGVEVEGV